MKNDYVPLLPEKMAAKKEVQLIGYEKPAFRNRN